MRISAESVKMTGMVQDPYLSGEERAVFAHEIVALRKAMRPSGWSQADLATALVNLMVAVCATIINDANEVPRHYPDETGRFILDNFREILEKEPRFAHIAMGIESASPEQEAAVHEHLRDQTKLWRDRIGAIEARRYRLPRVAAKLIMMSLRQPKTLSDATVVVPGNVPGVPFRGTLPGLADDLRLGEKEVHVSPHLVIKPTYIAFRIDKESYSPHFRKGEIVVVEQSGVFASGLYAVVKMSSGALELAALGFPPDGLTSLRDERAFGDEFEIVGYVVHREFTSPTGIQFHESSRKNSPNFD